MGRFARLEGHSRRNRGVVISVFGQSGDGKVDGRRFVTRFAQRDREQAIVAGFGRGIVGRHNRYGREIIVSNGDSRDTIENVHVDVCVVRCGQRHGDKLVVLQDRLVDHGDVNDSGRLSGKYGDCSWQSNKVLADSSIGGDGVSDFSVSSTRFRQSDGELSVVTGLTCGGIICGDTDSGSVIVANLHGGGILRGIDRDVRVIRAE